MARGKTRTKAAFVALFTAALFSGCAPGQPIDYSIPQYGTRSLVDPHGDWGSLANLQHAKIVESLNLFFAREGVGIGLPHGLMVRNHPNGKSLIYEWLGPDGQYIGMQQSARSSWWFTGLSRNGRAYAAQERDWGFVIPHARFNTLPWHYKASIAMHEFWHQSQQMMDRGALRYWYCYLSQFLTKGYDNIDGECEAHLVTAVFESFLTEHYGVQFKPARRVCTRCGVSLTDCR